MKKNYSKKTIFQPKDKTIKFLLNYSKSLSVIDLNFKKIEVCLN